MGPSGRTGRLQMKKLIIKILITVLAALLILAAAAGAAYSIKDNRDSRDDINARDELARALQAEIEPLKYERVELEAELANIEKSYSAEANGVASFCLIMADMSADIYKVILPEVQRFGYVGNLAVSDPAQIGSEGKLSAGEIRSLSAEGWSVIAAWDGTGDAAAHYVAIMAAVQNCGAEFYPAVLFTGERLESSHAAALLGAGAKQIILPETAEIADELKKATDSGVIRSAEWDRDGGNVVILSGIALHEDVVFTASADGINLALFKSMLDMLKMYESNIKVNTLGGRLSYREEAMRELAAIAEASAAREAAIEARIAEIKREINELYVKYGSEMSRG